MLDAARSGRGATLLVTGPPGLGKSALLEAAIEGAADFDVLRTTGIEAESELPFASLHALLTPLLGRVRELPEHQRAALALDAHGFATFAAVVSLLGICSERRPLLLVIDDAQWVDTASMDALVFATRRLVDDRVSFVFAAREVPTALRAARPPELRLEVLDAAAARALAGRRALGEAALRRVVELAEGVPLALVELAALGDEVEHRLALPGGVVERLFGERVERLPDAAATAALVAALEETGEADAMVRAAAALGATDAAWEQAERASVVRLQPGRIEFEHPLLRAAVTSRASPSASRAAHAALADALRSAPHRAAWHRAAAAIGPDETIAAALERAADQAGHAAAARALERAARLSPDASERARRLIDAGECARRAGRIEWADTLASEALAHPAFRTRAELLRAHVEAWHGSTLAAQRSYVRVAEHAGETELGAVALGYAAAMAVVAGDTHAALEAALKARRVPATQLSEATLVAVRESLGSVLALRGDSVRARPLLDGAVRWYEHQPRRSGAEFAAEALMWLGEQTRVRTLFDDVITEARRSGDLSVLNQALVLRADLGYRTGDWQRALADAAESVALARDVGQSVHLAYARAMLAILEAARGDEREARDDAGEARELGRRHGLRVVDEYASFALGALELARGRPEGSLEYLEPLAADVARTGRGEPAVVLWPADLIEALIATDRRDDAAEALAALDGQARRTGGAWAQGVVARYRGVLAGEADIDAAFEPAIACHERSQMPFELARTRLCYGERLRRAGRRIDARAQLRQALVCFDALGARGWAERARRELAGSGQRVPRGPQRDRERLTPQELQIARCVARGATNKEAAADLFLSPKTIETHLTRVYRKLGVRSRSELAVAMRDA